LLATEVNADWLGHQPVAFEALKHRRQKEVRACSPSRIDYDLAQ
jgi:hypothetical protein